MRIKINWLNTFAAIGIVLLLLVFPFVNPCQSESDLVCTYSQADSSFTNFYGIQLGGN